MRRVSRGWGAGHGPADKGGRPIWGHHLHHPPLKPLSAGWNRRGKIDSVSPISSPPWEWGVPAVRAPSRFQFLPSREPLLRARSCAGGGVPPPLASSHPGCQGNAHQWDSREDSGREKCQLLAEAPVKKGCCNFSQGSARRRHCWRKEIKHLVQVQGSCLRKPGRKEHLQPMFWVQSLASQKESFGVLLPPWVPDLPGLWPGLS